MGYTHYWIEETRPVTIPQPAVELIHEIVQKAYTDNLVQLELDDPREPIVTDQLIQFNGIGDQGKETFAYDLMITPQRSHQGYFSYCKTAQNPYDVIVMKALIVLKYYLGDGFHLGSDGRLDEWQGTLDEMKEKYGISLGDWQPR